MTTQYDAIRLDVEAGIATLTLNRPERLNSFTAAMHAELRDALQQVRGDRSVRCVVLTGAGRGFCAGQDLNERVAVPGGAPIDLGATIESTYKPLVLTLRGLPVPVIAAVNGVAAGAGANIALACDMVFAARSASFIQAFSKIGLVPDAGGTWVLPRLVGQARAMGLALLGEKLTAQQAQDWGLIWKCVDDAELMSTVRAVAAQFAAGPTRCFARTKEAIYASAGLSFEGSLSLERDFQRELGRSHDFQEGTAAFAAKRPPKFTGE
jgi:2-(1,2-epoxy-1,2-dihydrophenyl)acetyl-CoA isomerase